MTNADIRLRLIGSPTPGPCSNYFYLPEKDKPVYRSVREAMLMRRNHVSIPDTCTSESIQRIVHAVIWDEPMLYFVNLQSYRAAHSILGSSIQWELYYDEREIVRLDSRIFAELAHIRIPDGDVYRREVYLHNALIDQKMIYDSSNPGDWQNHCIIGPLLNRRAVCEGFAKAFLLLCRREGIPAMCVHGNSTSPMGPHGSHMWNIVSIGVQSVHVDPTWDINLSSDGEHHFDYLNLSDQQMALDHQWGRNAVPACDTDRYSAFQQCHRDFCTRAAWIEFLQCIDVRRTNKVFARIHFPMTSEQIGNDLSTHVPSIMTHTINYSFNEGQNVIFMTL